MISHQYLNPQKATHPPPGCIGHIVAVFQIVLALIGDHSITKAAPLQRRKIVFLAPYLVNLIQFFRTDGTVCFQPNISLGFQKIKNIIIVPFDSLPVVFGALALGKLEVVGGQPLQPPSVISMVTALPGTPRSLR